MNRDLQSTWHLHVSGLVQGIGFRPHVYLAAKHWKLKGWVKNDIDGLHIVFNATTEDAYRFTSQITEEKPPPLARITSVQLSKITKEAFLTFEIIHDNTSSNANLLLTPDINLCAACRQDVMAVDNYRHNYAFTSCSQCGPRYSIIEQLPYDRIRTKMNDFTMCDTCKAEYYNPTDRRYYAQTNSCPTCAITLSLFSNAQQVISTDVGQIIDKIIHYWEAGKIVAIKGIGGYLLTCDATQKSAIQRLRKLKHRPTKPLAVMYPTLESLQHLELSAKTITSLTGHISPIVLTPISNHDSTTQSICGQLDHIGIMLPYAPLFEILLKKYQRPIIATSGNISNSSITYQDENCFEELSEIADYLLMNNREIVIPQDDSVVTFTETHQQRIILRRSRGMAPTYINADISWSNESIVSTGAQLKSTFGILNNTNVYISQYLGNLDHYAAKSNYEKTLYHLLKLLSVKPNLILSDDHREYESSRLGLSYAQEWQIPIQYVQHHLAHFSAIIGEHNLLNTADRILGVIWDGAGLGSDGCIWGSEFFIYEDHRLNRVTHLPYYKHMLGDKMAKEPRLSAFSICYTIEEAADLIKSKFSKSEWHNYTQIIRNENLLQTSSMGRLFDAVASLLGIIDKQSYEGEAAMLLEVHARRYTKEDNTLINEACYYFHPSKNAISSSALIKLIIEDIKDGLSKALIAFKFHLTLVNWIAYIALEQKCTTIAFSGGVFQNSLLVDLLITRLDHSLKLYFHEELSPNDENISFGQLIYYQIQQRRLKNA